jgi:hypothetical protein
MVSDAGKWLPKVFEDIVMLALLLYISIRCLLPNRQNTFLGICLEGGKLKTRNHVLRLD